MAREDIADMLMTEEQKQQMARNRLRGQARYKDAPWQELLWRPIPDTPEPPHIMRGSYVGYVDAPSGWKVPIINESGFVGDFNTGNTAMQDLRRFDFENMEPPLVGLDGHLPQAEDFDPMSYEQSNPAAQALQRLLEEREMTIPYEQALDIPSVAEPITGPPRAPSEWGEHLPRDLWDIIRD